MIIAYDKFSEAYFEWDQLFYRAIQIDNDLREDLRIIVDYLRYIIDWMWLLSHPERRIKI